MNSVVSRAGILVIGWGVGVGIATAQQPQAAPPRFVDGYTDRISYVAGEEIGFCLSSNAGAVDLTIRRLGGDERPVWERANVAVGQHPVPARASSDGCAWPPALRLAVPADWPSGYYHVDLRTAQASAPATAASEPPAASSLFFIVRAANPGSRTPILLQVATNTYNAYTNWGGHSLYAYHDRDGLQGHRVSFDRPQLSQFGNWELPFIRWAESHGYTLDYAANSDLEFHPELLDKYRLILSVGHDEYWSAPMRDHLEAFIARGGNVAFFSGNTCCWQVRSEDDGRALVCWKQAYVLDPLFRNGDPRLLSTAWSHHLIGRPENQLTGVGFLWGGYHLSHGELMDGDGAYLVQRPEHWVLRGTGLGRGSKFGGEQTIVGYECDGCEMEWREGLPYPTGQDGTPASFEIVATAPARWAPSDSWWYDRFPTDRTGAAVLGVYTQGGTVFTCGSTDWAHGLAGGNPHVEQITRNILERLAQPGSEAHDD